MRCEECGKEIEIWWAMNDKWVCKECKKKGEIKII